MTEKCEAHNGTYVCQFEAPAGTQHPRMHYAYFIGDRGARIAYWEGQYGEVKSVKAPVPSYRLFGKGQK